MVLWRNGLPGIWDVMVIYMALPLRSFPCGEGAPMPSLCKSLGHFNNARTKYTDLSYLVNPAVNSWRWLKNVNIFSGRKRLG